MTTRRGPDVAQGPDVVHHCFKRLMSNFLYHCGLNYLHESHYLLIVIVLLLLCAVESSSVAVSLGKFKSSPTFDPETHSIKLAYEDGDECRHGSTKSKYSTNITLKCSPGYISCSSLIPIYANLNIDCLKCFFILLSINNIFDGVL